jgi:hypothetical protein
MSAATGLRSVDPLRLAGAVPRRYSAVGHGQAAAGAEAMPIL